MENHAKDAFKETFGLLLRLGVGAIVGRLAGGWE
jgi:hypothetical protein